jgi:hypothetical protein
MRAKRLAKDANHCTGERWPCRNVSATAGEQGSLEHGQVHDYFWHRRHRARSSRQLVDVAILVTLAAMVSLVLVLNH